MILRTCKNIRIASSAVHEWTCETLSYQDQKTPGDVARGIFKLQH